MYVDEIIHFPSAIEGIVFFYFSLKPKIEVLVSNEWIYKHASVMFINISVRVSRIRNQLAPVAVKCVN